MGFSVSTSVECFLLMEMILRYDRLRFYCLSGLYLDFLYVMQLWWFVFSDLELKKYMLDAEY